MTVFLASDEGFDFTPLFTFDATVSEEGSDSVTWSEYPVESGAVVSDFAARNPSQFTVSGIVTATPNNEGLDITRPGAIYEALASLVKERAQLWLSSPDYLALVVLDSCRRTKSAEEGEALSVEITAHTIERTEYEDTEIPLELLDPPIRPASATPQGTADATAEQESEPRKSIAAKIADGDFGALI